jgi:hypothetical protein
MKRYFPLIAGVLVALTLAGQATAKQPPSDPQTVAISMTFEEWLNPAGSDCPDIAPFGTNCGTGAVVPFGGATEILGFGGGCGGACDFRQVDLHSGSIFIDETSGQPSCDDPACNVVDIPLAGTIIGGTGQFTGASGSLTGSVHAPSTPPGPPVVNSTAHIAYNGAITINP